MTEYEMDVCDDDAEVGGGNADVVASVFFFT